MQLLFNNTNDAGARLNETIIRVDGEPIYIYNVNGDMSITFRYLNSKEHKQVSLSYKGIDMSPVPLGYINTRGRAYFASRKPARKWKQGLKLGSLEIKNQGKMRIQFHLPALRRTILNHYPNFFEAADKAARFESRYAYHRHFAVDHEMNIFFKEKKVGTWEGGYIFKPEYEFLRQYSEVCHAV